MSMKCEHSPQAWRRLADTPVVLCGSCAVALGQDCTDCNGEGISTDDVRCPACGGLGWCRYSDEAAT